MRLYTDLNLTKNGKTICTECQTVVWGCSRKKLYPAREKGGSAGIWPSEKDVHISAWMLAQIFCLDVDPSTGKYTMPAMRHKEVYDWYIEDCAKWPDCYKCCSESYFNCIWRERHGNVICRKWLRFAKCVVCVALRLRRNDRSLPKEERLKAADELRKHYLAMKLERAYHRR